MKTPSTQKAHRSVLGGVVMAAVVALACAPLLFAHADARDSARAVLRPAPVTIQSPDLSSVPAPTPPPPSGGITSVTDGSVNSGGNTGGHVTTGDQHVDVHEVNIGPTNPPPPPSSVDNPSPTPPSPQCDLRTRTGCPVQDPARTR